MRTDADVNQPRFDVRRSLGSGGFGEVFEAWDREQDAIVAVKRLQRQNPTAIRRFKQEFRSLARLSHPNLAQLYHLVGDGESWSFTMELVEGRDFVTAMRDTASSRTAQSSTDEFVGDEELPSPSDEKPTYDAPRVRGALRQLVRGVRALHAAGKLHRDLKPHNVLVTDQGRVVILDFGMVRELTSAERDPTTFVGTPHYMAPEQTGSAPVTVAADWYSVGVMLFEVLVGRYPVHGRTVVQLLLRKQCAEAPNDDAFPEGTPDDLRLACQALLQLEPGARPTADDLLDMLGDDDRLAPAEVVVRDSEPDSPLIGRTDELSALEARAREVVELGAPRIAALIGPSGIGKSALAWQFVAAQRERGALVWSSNCWENESVPYKAIDGIVDALVLHLASLPEAAVVNLLTGHIAALARVFPAFDHLQIVRDFAVARPASSDAPATRRAAFRSLRALVQRVSVDQEIVLLIDDAHWGDRDSAEALVEIFGRGEPPPVFLLLTYRDAERAGSPFLDELHERLGWPVEEMCLEPLDGDAARALAASCGALSEDVARIAVESGGDPYIIQQLSGSSHHGASVSDVILRRLEALPEDERAFVMALTVADRPVEAALIHAVAAVQTDLSHMLARLTNERLLRQRTGAGNRVECYHDRIRQVLRQRMPKARSRGLHLRLAETLLTRGGADAELLALHFREGGDRPRAALFNRKAAETAFELLAYDRAATAWASALEHTEWDNEARLEMQTQLGTALSYLGRGSESAEAFVRAAAHGSRIESLALRRRAAEQLLRAGQFLRGLELLNAVLADVDVSVPASPGALNIGLATNAARVWWRGLDFDEREEPLDPMEAERLDTLWAAANLMGTLDVKRGAYYTLLNVQRSLDRGDIYRVGRILALQAVHLASRTPTRPRAAHLLDQAESLIERSGDPLLLSAMVYFCRGMAAYMTGDIRASHLQFADVERRLANEGRFVWERKLVEIYDLYNLYHLGQYSRLAAAVDEGTTDARSRNDVMQWSGVVTWGHLVHLINDRPDAALIDLESTSEAWRVPGSMLLNDFWILQARVRVALYSGRPEDALDELRRSWAQLRQDFFLALDLTRAIVLDLRARANLMLARRAEGRQRRTLLRAASNDAAGLTKCGLPWATSTADLIEAQVAWLNDDLDGARSSFARAETGLAAQGYETTLGAVRVRLGELLGPRDLSQRALDSLTQRGVVQPHRFVSMLIPIGASG